MDSLQCSAICTLPLDLTTDDLSAFDAWMASLSVNELYKSLVASHTAASLSA